MSDLGDAAIEAASFTAAGAAMEAAAYGLNKMTAKAMLYVRILGASLDTTGSRINEDVWGLRSVLKSKKKSSEKLAARAGQQVNMATVAANAAKLKMSEAQVLAAMMSKGFTPMEVQYNPSSLRFNTVGGTVVTYKAMGNEQMNSMTSTDKQTSTYLNVELIFEDIDLADAFGSSSLGANVSDIVGTAKSVIEKAVGKSHSVKVPVEGLVSLLMNKESRQVIFVWNDMFFHGELVSVNANFTMFNKQGYPIRATVNLEIQQSNGNATFASDKQYWSDAFDLGFGVSR